MNKIIYLLKKIFFRRRRHERYPVCSNTFVLILPKDNKTLGWKVQAIDISEGGVAFVYQGTQEELYKAGFLKLFENDSSIDKIPYETRTDSIVNECKGYRRRGVEFKWLGYASREQIKYFIENNKLIC